LGDIEETEGVLQLNLATKCCGFEALLTRLRLQRVTLAVCPAQVNANGAKRNIQGNEPGMTTARAVDNALLVSFSQTHGIDVFVGE
jgi:hypothetical protein